MICVAVEITENTGELESPVSEPFQRALSFEFLWDSG